MGGHPDSTSGTCCRRKVWEAPGRILIQLSGTIFDKMYTRQPDDMFSARVRVRASGFDAGFGETVSNPEALVLCPVDDDEQEQAT